MFYIDLNTHTIENKENRQKIFVIDTGIKEDMANQPYMCKDGVRKTSVINSPYDTNGHGSDIVEIIASNMDVSKYCIVSISWYENMLSSYKGLRSIIEALEMVNKDKVKIVNLSLSGIAFDKKEFNEIKKLLKKGVIVNVASGNNGEFLTKEICNVYPTCYVNYLNNSEKQFFNSIGASDTKKSNKGYGINYYRSGKGLYNMSGSSQATAWFTNELVRK